MKIVVIIDKSICLWYNDFKQRLRLWYNILKLIWEGNALEIIYSLDLLKNSDQNFAIENLSVGKNSLDSKLSHIHKFYEILYVYSGERTITINNSLTSTLDMNNIAFVRPYQFHKTETNKGTPYKRILINFTYDFIKTDDDILNQKMLVCFNSQNSTVSFNPSQIRDINEIFQKILYEYNSNSDDFAMHIIKNLLSQLLLTASRSFSSKDAGNHSQLTVSPYYSDIYKISEYVKNNYSNKLTLDILSQEFNMSKFTISREFSKVMGCSFPTYLNNLRIRKSINLLINTKDKITTIAHECGYDSIKHFNRIFKSQFDISPSEYRRINKLK